MPTRRTSTRPDEPSTSSEHQMEVDEDVDARVSYICSIFLTENRDVRDKLCTSRLETEQPVEPVVEQIQRVEHLVLNNCVEAVLKDPKFAIVADLTKPVEEPEPARPTQLQPIEVKIEESDVSVLPSAGGETNVERAAKREAHVLSRIAELRKNGLWSNSRLPKCVEPERNKTHWDYLLEEVKWMATDFRSETNTKRRIAKALAGQIAKQHRDREIEVERAAERELRDKKRMCAGIAKMVRDFWQGVDKVVDIRAKEILESRLRKARNKHLMFMIGQVDEMSNIVQERLVPSKTPSITDDNDKEFEGGEESESDDERTIANAEKSIKRQDVRDEVDALQNEANVEMDDFLQSLPPEYLKMYGLTPEDLKEMKEQEEQDALEKVDLVKLNSNDSDERQQELANIAEEALKFQPKGYTLETTQVKTPVPFLIRGQLREYQMVGLDWMVTLYEKNLNGILADEMGLGKTIQTISLLAHLACSESIWGPHLIVVPTSVILNWEMEFKKWCPALKIMTYFGTAKERAEKRKGWMKPNCFHVCITSYKTVTQDIRAFKQRAWQYLILDEAQNIKNWKSQRWQALLNVRARRRLLLTGTPLQNSLMELWSLMHFLMPTIFSSHDDFKDWFSNPLTGMMEGSTEFNAPLIQRLHKVLRPFILRRLKKEVEKQLPEKTEHVVKCSLSKRQRYLYDDFMSRRSTKENLKSGNMMSVLNIVMQLRKCCNHPNLFEPRPVVAPFVVGKLHMDLPARLFRIAEQRPEYEPVPDMFRLDHRFGWQTEVKSRRPLIEEIETMDEMVEVEPPQVPGFRFNRTTFVGKTGREVVEGIGSEEEARGSGVMSPSSTQRTTRHPLSISTGGFHQTMSSSGVRNGLDERAAHSPPLKRPKLTGQSVRWADFVPAHVVAKTEASRRNQLEVVRRRFGHLRTPLVPNEMIALLRDEIGDGMASDSRIQEGLVQYIELLADRFGMYVEPVLTDAWQCRPSSSGLPSYIRHNMQQLETSSRSLLLDTSSSLDTRMSISRSLQFPELRLIEYDCGKLQTLAVLLRQLYVFKHRCLIFTQMSKMLDVLQTFLSHHGYQYFRLDGTTGIEQRQAMMERFNADPKIFCFILSTRSGGVGVNLTGADTVIFYDSDWNPTMDAQAQDRCHRIGQTRNVSIYRLISERTIEENILKKAMQKRRLGELAIDEAGFTPDFFKQSDNIRDLFDGENVDVSAPSDVPRDEKEMETAMAKCEDEVDVSAAKMATAEARVDVAEFEDRAMPVSKLDGDEEADEKYLELIQQLKPIERFAINLLEAEYKPEFEEECKEAEAMIEQKREEWDKNLNNADEPENTLNNVEDDDDALFNSEFYAHGSLLDEIMADNFDEMMPIWLPPSPPASDADFDLRMEDDTFDLLYEIDPMNETRLPQVTHDLRRPLAEKQKQNQNIHDILSVKEKESVYDAVTRCLQMTPAEPAAASPAYTENSFSMDDSSQDAKMEPPDVQIPAQPVVQQKAPKRRRNDNRAAQNRNGESGVKRATTPPPAFREESDYDGAEWNIVEDYALLQAVQLEFANLHLVERSHLEGMVLNWELVANAVNKQTRFFRSARQCSIRYQMFVRPKELGQLVASDPITKKTVKVDLSATELSHLRRSRMTTESQYNYDYGLLTDKKHMNRFKTVRQVAARRQVQFWRGPRALESRNLQSLAGGMPQKHEMKMAEFDVKLGIVLDAEDVATLTDEQIAIVEANKKKLVASRQTRPSVKPEIRYHTLVLRPYTIPICSEYPPLPSRKDMRVAVPPLQAPSPAPSATPTPLPSLQSGLQLPPLQPPQPMPIRQVGLEHQQHQIQQQPQPTIQRRTASGTNMQFIQQGVVQQGQSYMVVPSGSQQMAQQVQMPQIDSQQPPPPQQPGQPQQQQPQRVQYVQGARGGYANTLVMPRGSRVVRPGNMQQRVYIAPERQYGMPQVVPVRVMPSNQQRMMPGGARRNQPAPGTVAAMVLPNRGNGAGGGGGVAQMRQIPRGGGSAGYAGQQRINVMVTAAPAMRPVGGQPGAGGQGGVRRQLVGRPLSQRVDSTTPTVAQVVVAPPSGMNTGGGPPVLHMQRSAPPQAVPQPPSGTSESAVTSSTAPPPPPKQA